MDAKKQKVVDDAGERISQAKFGLFKKYPMYSYLVDHLRLHVTEDVETMAVNERGDLYVNPDFCMSLPHAQVMGVLAHETLHVALYQIPRGRGRVHLPWNFAIDIAVNYILQVDGMELPSTALLTDLNSDSISLGDLTIQNVSKKSAEEIYEEFKVDAQKNGGKGKGKGRGEAGEGKGFDEHVDADSEDAGDGKDGKGNKENGIKEGAGKKDWSKVLAEAEAYAKQMGKESLGMKRELYEIRRSKINWRSIIRKVVSSAIPYDLTFSRPHKSYLAFGMYLPTSYGEKASVLVSVDTSGSIGHKELSDFMSEVVAIARSYPQVDFRILTHDVDVHDDYKVVNSTVAKLQTLELHGGGGTSHKPLYEYISKHKCKQHSKLLLSLTDGYSDFPEHRPNINTLFVLAGNHVPTDQMPKWANSIVID